MKPFYLNRKNVKDILEYYIDTSSITNKQIDEIIDLLEFEEINEENIQYAIEEIL